MLALDDSGWLKLEHRAFSHGVYSQDDPDAPNVPRQLEHLKRNPLDLARFRKLSPYLCSEGSVYQAAFAAVPYVVDFMMAVSPSNRIPYISFLGCVSSDRGNDIIPKWGGIEESFYRSMKAALPLVYESLTIVTTEDDVTVVLYAIAAMKNFPRLANKIIY
jgi:hypothetical protein